MSTDTEERKLAAIMFTDMVGYSALSQRNGRLAVELLEEHRELLRKIFPRFHGSEIKTIGDAFLVEFNSALEAAQCAIEIQRALAKRDADAPADRQIQLRIGIHIGDVIHRGGDVYGDGVNIASRIEPLASPGGICLSMDVERQIRNAVETRFEKLAPTELKNISVPMDLFRIVLPWEIPAGAGKSEIRSEPDGRFPKFEGERSRSSGIPWHEIVIGALLVAALIGGALVWFHRSSHSESAAASAPEKSIAVLPFENLSEEKANAFFADGVQDEILTDLAKIADLKVISRTSVMQYKSGVARNLRKIGEELGVSHVVEGSVQRAANTVRVNAQLIDARNDAHLWAQTYDRDLADVFAIQSEIAQTIAGQLQAKILPQERKAIEKQPTTDIAAQDLYILAVKEIDASPESSQPKELLLAAVDLLEQAVKRDPAFLNAFCQQARAHDMLYLFGEDHTAQRLSLAEQAVDAALRAQPNSPEAHLARANHLYSKLDYDGALAELEVVQRTLPNEARAFELSGYIDRRQGRWEESMRNLEHALQLDPNNVFLLDQIATSYQDMRDYPKAAATLDRILSIRPDDLNFRLSRTQTDVFWKADARPAHDVIASAIARDPANARRLALARVFLAFAERDANGGMQALADSGEKTFGPNALQFPLSAGDGVFARLKGDAAAAQASFARARAIQEKVVEAQPDYGPALCILAVIDAGLGRKEEAIREGRRSLELLPLTKDAINGAHMLRILAMIYAWVGEKDLAIEQLKRAVQVPGGGSYGELKLFPQWDPLRGDPRFEEIVASLAPR